MGGTNKEGTISNRTENSRLNKQGYQPEVNINAIVDVIKNSPDGFTVSLNGEKIKR